MAETIEQVAEVPEDMAGNRLDQVAAQLFPDYSRARLQLWIKSGELTVDGEVKRPREKLLSGEILRLEAQVEDEDRWEAQDIALDVVYEDEALIVVNKPAGLVVHPAAGHASGTLLNALLNHMAGKLPISRWQRDLTDSTVQRNFGMAIAYAVIAINSTIRGLGKLQADSAVMTADLDNNWAVLGEAVQTVMRRYGIPEPYEKLKALTRGNVVDQKLIQDFVRSLDIPEDARERLLHLTPATYTGLAESLLDRSD